MLRPREKAGTRPLGTAGAQGGGGAGTRDTVRKARSQVFPQTPTSSPSGRPRVPTLAAPCCHTYLLAGAGVPCHVPAPPRMWGLVSITFTASLFCSPHDLSHLAAPTPPFLLPVPFSPVPALPGDHLPPAPPFRAGLPGRPYDLVFSLVLCRLSACSHSCLSPSPDKLFGAGSVLYPFVSLHTCAEGR